MHIYGEKEGRKDMGKQVVLDRRRFNKQEKCTLVIGNAQFIHQLMASVILEARETKMGEARETLCTYFFLTYI